MIRIWKHFLWQLAKLFSRSPIICGRDGFTRYSFKQHILILGGSRELLPLLRAIAAHDALKMLPVVVLADSDCPSLLQLLRTRLQSLGVQSPVTLYRGCRTCADTLRTCQVDSASHIFILGEDDEPAHDSLNVSCWQQVRQLRAQCNQLAQCYLMLRSSTSTFLFHSLQQEAHNSLETTIINSYESLAQQLLVGDIYHNDTLTLDRGLVTVGSDRFVHLVVVGMTPMGYAFAATAAQLCHFPNFDESAPRPIRTRITFVDPSANELMDCFKASYPGIFDLSHVRYIEQPGAWLQGVPQRSLGDFVDVEWQFVKGNISSEWIRDMLSACAADSRQVLSVALCGGDSARNLAEAYRLPRQLYPLPDSNNSSPLTPVVYVYQPDDSSLVQTVQNEVLRFHNVVPFGFNAKGFDPLHSLRIAAAKRINYLYQKENSGKVFTSMPADEALLNELWRQLSSAEKTAALLAANATNTFIRSFGLSRTTLADHLSDDALVESFAAVDHARRNMACLLAGYSAMPADQRARLNSALQSADNSEREEATIQSKYSKCMLFVDKDITPYALLPENLKQYYRAIVRNIHVVC